MRLTSVSGCGGRLSWPSPVARWYVAALGQGLTEGLDRPWTCVATGNRFLKRGRLAAQDLPGAPDVGLGRALVAHREAQHVAVVQAGVRDEDLAGPVHPL